MIAMEPISAQRDADDLMLSKNKQNTKLYMLVSPGSSFKEMSPKPRLQDRVTISWRAVVAVQTVMGRIPSPMETYVDAVTVLS